MAKNRLPAMYLEARWVEEGGMMAYGTDPIDCAAIFVDKILKGANAAELPVEQPTKFELAINLKTASRLEQQSLNLCCFVPTRWSRKAPG